MRCFHLLFVSCSYGIDKEITEKTALIYIVLTNFIGAYQRFLKFRQIELAVEIEVFDALKNAPCFLGLLEIELG